MAKPDNFTPELIQNHLDTRDKRFLFLKIFFPHVVSQIDLEGSARECAFRIYFELEKHEQLEKLKTHLYEVFLT